MNAEQMIDCLLSSRLVAEDMSRREVKALLKKATDLGGRLKADWVWFVGMDPGRFWFDFASEGLASKAVSKIEGFFRSSGLTPVAVDVKGPKEDKGKTFYQVDLKVKEALGTLEDPITMQGISPKTGKRRYS